MYLAMTASTSGAQGPWPRLSIWAKALAATRALERDTSIWSAGRAAQCGGGGPTG